MGGFSPIQRDVIARLKLDPSDLKKGYADAKAIQAQAHSEMLALDAQRQRMRGELESKYTTDSRAQIQQRITDLRAELAATIGAMQGKSAAEKSALAASAAATKEKLQMQVAEMDNYRNLITRLGEVTQAYRQQAAVVKEAQAAKIALGSAGGGMFDRVLSGFTLAGAGQMLGITALASSLPMLLHSIGAGLVQAATDAGEYAHQLDFMSQKTGIAVRDLQQFQAIGKVTGLTLEDLVIAQRRFSVAITGQAAMGPGGEVLAGGGGGGGSSRGPAILKALEIPNKDAITGAFREVKAVMLDVADVFAKLPDGAEKSRIAIELFGRSGLNLIPFLNLGREGMKQLQDTFEQFMPDIANVADLHRQLDISAAKWDVTMMALKTHLSTELMPTIITLVENLASLAGIKAQGGSVIDLLLTGSTAVPGLENNLAQLIKASGLRGMTAMPGAEKRFQELLAPPISVAAALIPEGGTALLQEELSSQRKTLDRARAQLPAGANQQQVAIQVLINEGLVKQVDKEKESNKLLDERMKKVNELLAGQGKADDARAGALERLALAEGKEGTIQSQLAEAHARVNALIKERVDLMKVADQASVQTELTKVINEEAAAMERLVALQKKHETEVVKAFKKPLTPRTGLSSADFARAGELQAGEQAAPILAGMPMNLPDVFSALMAAFSGPQMFGAGRLGMGAGRPSLSMMQAPSALDATLGTFTQRRESLAKQQDIGLISNEKALEVYKQQVAELKNLKQTNVDILTLLPEGTTEWSKQFAVVQKIDEALKNAKNSMNFAQQHTELAQLMNVFDQLASVAGKFSGGLGKVFSEIGASVKATTTAYKDFQKLMNEGGSKLAMGADIAGAAGGGISAAFGGQGIAGVFSSMLGMGSAGAMLGTLAGGPVGAAIGGTIGAAVGAVTGTVGAFKTAKQADAMRDVTEIQEAVKDITKNMQLGVTTLTQGMAQLQQQRSQAVADTTRGKGGNLDAMTQTIAAIDDQITQLQVKQQQILHDFKAQIGTFSIPPGVQTYADGIVKIAQALKDAAGAGASAADQVKFLNGTLDQLKQTIGQSLRTEEQQTVNMMLQSIDLTAQRAQIVTDEALQETNIRRSLGLAVALTPAQQAAQQIAILRKNRDLQLAQIDQQKAMLQAQLDGQMQLFGWTQKDLTAADTKKRLLAEQLDLQRSITAETIASITAQTNYFAALAAGKIPKLPASVYPANFNTGSMTYSPQVTVNVAGTNATPEQIAKAITDVLKQINIQRQMGLQP
jgi:hypothetical protein